MGSFKEKLDGQGLVCRGRKFVRWAKRQHARYRRRLGKAKMEDTPKDSKTTKGWEA